MPEWLVEAGIGETRAALVADGEIVEARIEIEGSVSAGTVLAARLTSIGQAGRNAVASADGVEYLLAVAPRVTQGAALAIEVTRAAFPGVEPWKRPLARVSEAVPGALPSLAERLLGRTLGFPTPHDALEEGGWSRLIEEARSGIVEFGGGALRLSPTPAMTLIDVDGVLPSEELALAGVRAAARTIRRLAIGGSIGIDLPTVRSKAARMAQAEAIDALLPQPYERTAVNGFGFVQIVRPRTGPSLIELAQDRAGFEARALLRRAARSTGAIRLVAYPALVERLEAGQDKFGWIERLARQVGGAVSLRGDPLLAMSGAYAEPV